MTLLPPDSHHVSAAIGWLELGNPAEAESELENISLDQRFHPDVLSARWQICAKLQNWEKCAEVARQATEVSPEDSFGWVHFSFALHEMKRTQEAHDNLIGVLDQFPDEWLMRYNLACYSCQLGNLEEAARWLAGAALKGDAEEIQSMAKDDPDLSALFSGR